MINFLTWAEGADDAIVKQLGAQYVDSEISESSATWTYGMNRVVATPVDDGITAEFAFKIGDDENMIMADHGMQGALIAGWLAGKH
jgi:sugar (pentulose or hexulose) kinase